MMRRPAGYTLIEMLVSLAIVSVVLVATGSAIVLASRALPDRSDASVRLSAAAALRERIASELAYATGVTELSPTAITFAIADQNNDLADEVIRYAWSGQPGDPVTRRLNGAAPVSVLDDVREFQFAYDRLQEPAPTTYAVSNEQVLFNFGSQGQGTDFTVDSSNWPVQYFRPALPSDASWWRVTRVSIQVRANGAATGETRVQVRGVDSLNKPTSRVYDQVALAESALPATYVWRDVVFARDARIPAGQGACIVMQWVRDTASCDVRYRANVAAGMMLRTTDGGTSWLTMTSQLNVQVRGVIATPSPQQYRYTLTDVRLALRCGSEGSNATYCASVRLLNAPHVGAP